MQLQVLSLKGVEYNGEIKSVNVRTTSGGITVMDHHLPLITVLNGRLVVKDTAGNEKTIPAASGFLEVALGNKASALIS